MAKDVKFNIRLNIDGKEQIVTASTNVRTLAQELGIASTKGTQLRDSLLRITQLGQSFQNALSGIQQLTGLMQTYTAAARVQAEAEVKLKTVMAQRMNATDEEVDSIKELCAAQQELGIIGDEVQLAGAQQVATFLNEKSSLETLIPAMNNLIAQQRGFEASQSDAVSVANLMGKAMQGQTSALTRVGITFNAAQEQILKYGNESERAATLAQVITDNVGAMNEQLAATDAGKAKQTANAIGDIKEQIGQLFSSIEPTIVAVGELGLALSAIGTMTTGFRGIYVAAVAATGAIKGMSLATLAQTAATKVSTIVQSLWAKQLYYGRQAQIAWTFSARLATVQAIAMRAAILGLMAVTGLGIAFAAVSSIISLFASNTEDATEAMEDAEKQADKLSKANNEESQTYTQVSSTLNVHKERLKQLIEAKKLGQDVSKKEKSIVGELNQAYGETMGYFSSVSDWYKALTANSEAYCRQMVLEAKTRRLANQIAEKEAEKHNILYDEQGNKRKYSTQNETREVWKSADGAGSYRTTEEIQGSSDWAKANAAVSANNKAIDSLTKQLKSAAKEASEIELSVKGSATPIAASTPTKVGKGGTTTDTETKDKQRQLIENASTYEELANNVAYYQERLEKCNIADTEQLLTLARKKAAAEEAVKAFRDLVDIQSDEQKVADMKDDEITTYDQLNKKLDYYNKLLRSGDESQRIFAQEGINRLKKLQGEWDNTLDAMSVPTTTDTLGDINDALSFYTARQQREDADNIQATQQIINALEKKKKALETGIEIPNLQDEIADINSLTSKEQTIRIREIGIDALKGKVQELRDMLADTDNPLTASQREDIEEIINVYEKWQRQAVDTFGTITDGWNAIKGIGGGIEGITSAVKDNANAWRITTAVVDGFIQIFEGVKAIIGIIKVLTTLSEAHTTAKAAEATATTLATAATTANAVGEESAAAATIPLIVANKAATASYAELATAGYMAAHAAIPFAGFGIAAGFSTAAKAMILAMGATPFADGGVVFGPTYALVGEYAGAANNPEVIAPLDKLASIIQPDGAMGGGKVVFELRGRKLIGVMQNEDNINALSGKRNNILS